MIRHKEILLPPYSEGVYLITDIILREASPLPEEGILFLFLKHTSAGITLNENASPDVRSDFRNFIKKLVPENLPFYTHILEGADDMPAHIKSSLIGTSLHIPIKNGKLMLGTWQGIYFCEFRKQKKQRKIIISIFE